MNLEQQYQETEKYIFDHLPMFWRQGASAFKKDLTNIKLLCEHLGNPQDTFKSIHIGGTNGKGSTTHYLASLLIENGLKVGIYSSPHLIDYRERIKIGNSYISKEFVIAFIEKMKEKITEIQPSYFELSVAMAFDYFRFQKVDIACIEVGLGGRLDSTNIINPILSIITNIGFDHMAILGNSLDAIAFEKSGIIKSNTPVIIGEKQEESVQNVFEEKANLIASKILWAENEFSISENNSFYEMENKEIKVYINKLYFGASYHQINIRTVLSAYAYLQKNQLLDLSNHPEIISKGIENFYKNTHFMGRWMPHPKRNNVFFETAHNEDGIKKLIETISNYSYQNLYIIFGAVNDKDVETVSKLLPKNANYIITQADVPRALDAKTLSQIFISQGQKVIFDFPIAQEAYNKGLEIINEDDLLIITGSIFLVGEILKNEQSNFL